jgi:hypothetical protein
MHVIASDDTNPTPAEFVHVFGGTTKLKEVVVGVVPSSVQSSCAPAAAFVFVTRHPVRKPVAAAHTNVPPEFGVTETIRLPVPPWHGIGVAETPDTVALGV